MNKSFIATAEAFKCLSASGLAPVCVHNADSYGREALTYLEDFGDKLVQSVKEVREDWDYKETQEFLGKVHNAFASEVNRITQAYLAAAQAACNRSSAG